MRERAETLRSAALGNERTVWIRPPERPEQARSLTVFLDGELYRDRVQAPDLITSLRAAGELADSWYAFVSVADDAARWRECPCHPPFAAFVRTELMPWLIAHTAGVPQERIIVGASYTALAAAYVAKECPGAFARVICQSGSFWWNDGWLIDQCVTLPRPLPSQFYLQVGTRETQAGLQHRPDVRQTMSQLAAVRQFRDALLACGNDVTHVETGGAHDSGSWREALPEALRWALRPGPHDAERHHPRGERAIPPDRKRRVRCRSVP